MATEEHAALRVLRVCPVGGEGGETDTTPAAAEGSVSVASATGGREALDRLDREAVDCVLCEPSLGDMSGVDFVRRLREERPALPVVLIVPTGEPSHAGEAIAAGATDCLPEAWATVDEIVAARIERAVQSIDSPVQGPPEVAGDVDEYRLLVENVEEYAIFMLDPDGHVVSWNRGARNLKGYERTEILGEHFSVFYPHDAVEIGVPEANLEAALREGHVEDEGWRVREDGSQFWARVTITAIYDDSDELKGFAKITRDMTERREKEAALVREGELNQQFRLLVEQVEDYAIFRLDTNGNVVSWNAGATRIKGYDADEILGRHFSVFYPRDAVERGVPQRNLERAVAEGRYQDEGWRVRSDGSQFWAHVTITALRDDDGDLRGFAKVTRDMTERRQYEQELERHRDELAALDRINSVIRAIDREIVEATTQEAVESAVTARLADDGTYAFASIGSVAAVDREIAPRSWSGGGEAFLDDLSLSLGGDADPEMIGAALQTHRSQVVQNVREDPASGPWRRAALERGFHAAAAIPIVFEERIFGVLCVYENRPYAFDEREVTVLEELGETIGHAINALQTKKMLLAETVKELEFLVTDPRSVLVSAATSLDAAVRVAGVVPASDDAALYYATVCGASADDVEAFAMERSDIDRVRVIDDAEDRCFVELVVTERTPALALADYGGTLRTAAADEGDLRMVVDVPAESDVRAVVEEMRSIFDHDRVDLIAQREVDRSDEGGRDIHASLGSELTDRQRTVLSAAYHSGYLEQPRESTGEELARALGITASTFHQHFRTAERKLVDAYLTG